MVFVFPVGEQLFGTPARVLARKSYGCRVLMDSRTVELENFDDSQRQPKEHVFMSSAIEPEKRPADLVVVNVAGLLRTESQLLRVQWPQPVLHLVQWMGRREDIVDQQREYFIIVELHAFIAHHVGAENLTNSHGLNKLLNDRVSSQYEFRMNGVLFQAALSLHLAPCPS